MAVNAGIFYSDGVFALDLYPGVALERVGGEPPGVQLPRGSPLGFEWDGEKLERGEHALLGLKVFSLEHLTEDDLRLLERLQLPRVSCPEAGLVDVAVVDAVCWAKATFHGVQHHIFGWPATVAR